MEHLYWDKITAGLRWNKLATNPLPAPRSAMKIIECEGSPQSLGEQTGDLREEIRGHISLRPMASVPLRGKGYSIVCVDRGVLFLEGHPCQREFTEIAL